MSKNSQWIERGLDGIAPAQAARVRVFRLLLARAAQLRAQLDRVLAPSGVTAQQGGLLQWIEAQPEPPTIGAVAAGLGMTHQNVKQIAAALQRKQFLLIEVDASDRRARRLVLTDHHRQFWQQRNPDDFVQVAAWTASWSDDEVATVAALLARLGDGAADEPP